MKIVGLIPARGGSVRIPRKNIIELGGKPLIAWTIEAAKNSLVFDWLVCSTDDEEIGKTALRCGVDQVVWRPEHLARPESPTLPVIRHALALTLNKYDVVMLLQPTSPFRSAGDIRSAVRLMTQGEQSVISSAPDTMLPNGAIYAIRTEALRSANCVLYGDTSARMVMPYDRSLDIDTPEDLQLARVMLPDIFPERYGREE